MATNHLKRPHYDNCLMLDMHGAPLSTVGEDRIQWYLDRNLGHLVEGYDSRYTKVLQLNFKNKSDGRSTLASDIISMTNQCVVCGRSDTLSAHHVVPYGVKRHYPMHLKSHTRHQVVLLCEEHHLAIEALNKQLTEDPYAPLDAHFKWVHRMVGRYGQFLKRWAVRYWRWRKGGVKAINQSYIDLFMTMKPKHLPPDWLQP